MIDEVLQQVQLSPLTKAVCTSCGREDAPMLFLKRSQGLYSLLCRMQDGSGCYPNSARQLCSHFDEYQVPCVQLAEWEIAHGEDGLFKTRACSDHVGSMLGTAQVYKVYPLDRD